MNIAFWNIRCLVDMVRQSEVRHFVRENKICCLGLLETKVSPHLFGSISSSLCSGWQWIGNYEHSVRGHIWVGWNPVLVEFKSFYVSSQAIHGMLKVLHIGLTLYLTAVRPLWSDIIRLNSNLLNDPWLVAGDFNAIRDSSNRLGSPETWLPSFDEFSECICQAGLDDLQYVGMRFTWSTSSRVHRKQRKINRVLVNSKWSMNYSYSEAAFLPPGILDHSPMLVKMTHPDFNVMVSQVWDTPITSTPMYKLYTRLKLLKKKLKHLNK
ncbi:hypothetical protein BT93_J1616 [Corymbia citriodora subsp. variegata]|nr:hypothetical protein BT93_J1616 [Corymbia citriodora subsp. variegata]